MTSLENKKISIKIILISILSIIMCSIIKHPYTYRGLKKEYFVSILLFDFDYQALMVVLLIILGLGVYWYLLKTDDEIKQTISSLKINVEKKSIIVYNKLKDWFNLRKKEYKLNKQIQRKDYSTKNTLKLISLISGIILIAFYFFINNIFDKSIENEISQISSSLNTTRNYYDIQNPHFIKSSLITSKYNNYLLIISIIVRLYATIICVRLTKYNKGHYILWGILSITLPYVSLILAGLKISSKK